jgi:ATP-dependent RNA helicase SUPV3L1/SUV3
MQIINSNSEKEKEIKMKPEMLNLLGCNKENFKKLLKNMNYNVFEKDNDVFFKYVPKKTKQKNFTKKSKKESPFGVLKNLNF